MLQKADRPIEGVIRAFAARGVEAAFLVPTDTGLGKSIMDAHGQLRDYLRREGLHDYAAQAQGPASKKVVRAWHLGAAGRVEAKASLYRPETKEGDPRIWVTGLPRHARAGNLLAIFAHAGELYVANASAPGVVESLDDPSSPLGRLVREIALAKGGPATELLGKLRGIAAGGFVRSLRRGPTGVGMTLETLLGIQANSSKAPDYKGIEIKASRTSAKGGQAVRSTLFSKVPDWNRSAVKSAVELLRLHGYDKEGRRQLYCSMGNEANSLGLFLAVEGEDLHAMRGTTPSPAKVVQWAMDGLRDALAQKHRETFWVKAVARRCRDGAEEFQYATVVHTRAPMVSNLDALLGNGRVEVDFLLHLVPGHAGAKPRARDHGYLFKIRPSDIGLLFPPPTVHCLA